MKLATAKSVLLIGLWLAVMVSALAVVLAKHEARLLFTELQQLHTERDRLDIEWGRLRIEQSTWSAHGRIEQLARDELSMTIPTPPEVRILKP